MCSLLLLLLEVDWNLRLVVDDTMPNKPAAWRAAMSFGTVLLQA